jgi:outer membrane lipoprotein SlyB
LLTSRGLHSHSISKIFNNPLIRFITPFLKVLTMFEYTPQTSTTFARLATLGVLAIAMLSSALLSGCATPSSSGNVYRAGEARREQAVRMGIVESVREVTIENSRTGVGAIGGAVVGGVAGSNIGKGKGATVGTVLGAVAGGIAGQAIEKGVGNKKGLEITVKLDSGELRAYVQEADETFRPGERVRIVSQSGTARVTH